jgi:hypothetical protein
MSIVSRRTTVGNALMTRVRRLVDGGKLEAAVFIGLVIERVL